LEKSKAVFKKRKFKRTFKRKLSMRDIGVLEFLWTWKFEAFTVTLKEIIRKEERPDTMAAIIRKLVQKIEVTESGVVIHYHVGENLFVREFNEELGSDMLNSDPKNKTGQVNLTRPVSKSLLKYKSSNFFYDSGSNSLKIGSQPLRTCNYYQQHDFVELFQKDISRIFNVCSPLYLQGYSLSEVSNLTGFAYTTARDHLVKGGATLRPKNSANSKKISRQKYKSSAAPLFGYVYLEGKLQKDQKEFPVLQIIWNQWKIGQSATSITHYLNDKKIRTRKHREWKRTTILNILQRFENKIIVL